MSSLQPAVSVIIAAYSRRNYLLEAIQSVLSQELNRSDFEIIVTKNFWDSEIDNLIERNKITQVTEIVENPIQNLLNGIRKSSGKILSFLDDDDEFYPQKLGRVVTAFDSDPELGYFHNAFVYVDEKDVIEAKKLRPQSKNTFHFNKGKISVNELRSLFKSRPDFNLSCISIKREIIERNISMLAEMHFTADTFMFLIAYNSGTNMLVDNIPLTKYRVSSSLPGNPINFAKIVQMRTEFIEKQHEDLRNLLEMSSETRTHELIKFELNESILIHKIITASVGASDILNFIANFSRMGSRGNRYYVMLLFFGILTCVAHRFGPRTYFHFIQRI